MQEARNLLSAGLNAGFSLIQQVANVRNANDSSDDEVTDLNEDEEFIQRGSRGILVFTTISIRTGKKKMVHLHLYRGSITQYNDNKKTVFICSDIQSITKNTEKFIVVEFRGAMEVQTRQKRFLFESEAIADRFQQYVEFVNEFGRVIRQSFNQIDYTRTGRINRDDLEEALLRVDLQTDADAVTKM